MEEHAGDLRLPSPQKHLRSRHHRTGHQARPRTDVENQNGNGHSVSIERVLDWAKAEGFRTGDNPARWPGSLEVMLGKPNQDEESMPALPYRELPAFLAELRRQEGIAARALALS
jgi:hypothetical protein